MTTALVDAIYHGPLDVIRMLLQGGADPNAPVDDGFAVAERNGLAVHRFLEGGADPDLKTRIDDYETAGEMAEAAGLADIAALLVRKGQPLRQRLRSGLTLLLDVAGTGEPVRRQHNYRIRLRLWLHKGDAVRWQTAWGPVGIARLEDEGATLVTEVRIDRRSLMAGLFYGVEGMRVGGTRRLEIAPHLAYGNRGVPEIIPADALLTAEITFLESESASIGPNVAHEGASEFRDRLTGAMGVCAEGAGE